MRRSAVAVVSALLLVFGLAFDATAKQGGSPNNQADIDGTFSADCTDFHGESDKDISHVEWWYLGDDQSQPGQKDERISSPEYDIEGDEPIARVRVKSARTVEDFHCAGPEGPPGDETCADGYDNDGDGLIDGADPDCQAPPAPECSDGVDNTDPEDTLADEADPGCHTDGDPNNPNTYDPNDDDETDDTPPAPECSDGVDNTDPEDTIADEADPGCHTDGDPDNPDTYDPNDDDETDEPAGGTFTCRASAARIEFASGQVVEPVIANDADAECAADDASPINETLGGEPTDPGSLTVSVVKAETTEPGSAAAAVANVVVRDSTGATVLEVALLTSDASVACVDGEPAFTSSSTVVGLFVLGTPVEVSDHMDIPLGPNGELGTVHVNEEITETTADGEQRTQRALWLEGSPLGDVIVAEAIADYHGDPC